MTAPRALVLAALGLVGCPRGSTEPLPTVSPAEASPRATLGDDVFVQASARGPTEDEAYAAARHSLAQAVLGDAAWAELAGLEVHRRDVDPQASIRTSDGVDVAVGLPRERVSALVLELESSEPPARGPIAWQDTLQAYLRAHVAAHACVRRIELFSVQCEATLTDEVDAAIADLGNGLALVPAYRDGVPVDPQGRALREPAVFVVWRGVPLAGLPMRVDGPGAAGVAEDRLVTDAQGRARVLLRDGAELGALRLRVDGPALLGPRAHAAPRTEVKLEPRPVSRQRWALVIDHRGRAPRTRDRDPAGAVVTARLRSAGLESPRALADHDAETLRTASADRRGERLLTVADAMSGQLDLLLVLSYDTRFASRMGGGRVWYEAEGTLEARDAWTGRVLAQAKTRVEADGMGDDEADAAARRTLAEALTTEVLAALRAGEPPRRTEP